MPDTQQKAVYAWERAWGQWLVGDTPKHRIRRWVRAAERLYGIPPSRIEFRTRGKNREGRWLPSTCWADIHYGIIALRPHHCSIPVAMHETAHAIMGRLFGAEQQGMEGHGPQWMGVYLCLLTWAKVAPRVALEASAHEFGLRWTPPGRIGPGVIRKHYRGKILAAAEEWPLA